MLGTLAFGLLPLSGAVIIARQPRNPVGWLAAAAALVPNLEVIPVSSPGENLERYR